MINKGIPISEDTIKLELVKKVVGAETAVQKLNKK